LDCGDPAVIAALTVIGVLLAALVWLCVYVRWFFAPDKRPTTQPDATNKDVPWTP